MTRGFLVVADRCFGCSSCAMACRAWSGDGWAVVLELSSRSEERAVWIPYLCSQVVPDPPCGSRGVAPPCELACPTRAIQHCDLDALRPNGRARPLPLARGAGSPPRGGDPGGRGAAGPARRAARAEAAGSGDRAGSRWFREP
jgi:hypothetical protein